MEILHCVDVLGMHPIVDDCLSYEPTLLAMLTSSMHCHMNGYHCNRMWLLIVWQPWQEWWRQSETRGKHAGYGLSSCFVNGVCCREYEVFSTPSLVITITISMMNRPNGVGDGELQGQPRRLLTTHNGDPVLSERGRETGWRRNLVAKCVGAQNIPAFYPFNHWFCYCMFGYQNPKTIGISKTALKKAPQVSKLRFSNFHTCTSHYLKYLHYAFLFQLDDCSLSYWSSTYQHDLEASGVVVSHSERIHWQTLCSIQFCSQHNIQCQTRVWLAPCPLNQNEICCNWSICYLQPLADLEIEWHKIVIFSDPRVNNLALLYLKNYSYLKIETSTMRFQSPSAFEWAIAQLKWM